MVAKVHNASFRSEPAHHNEWRRNADNGRQLCQKAYRTKCACCSLCKTTDPTVPRKCVDVSFQMLPLCYSLNAA